MISLSGIIRENLVFNNNEVVELDGLVQLAEGFTIRFEAGSSLEGKGNAIEVFGSLEFIGSTDNLVEVSNTLLYGESSGRLSIDYGVITGGALFPTFNNDGELLINHSLLDSVNEIDINNDSSINSSILNNTNIRTNQVDQPEIIANTFTGSSQIKSFSWISGDLNLQNNNFITNDVVLLLSPFFDMNHNVSASGNYWGLGELGANITDGNDDLNIKGTVDLSNRSNVINDAAPMSIGKYFVDRNTFDLKVSPEPTPVLVSDSSDTFALSLDGGIVDGLLGIDTGTIDDLSVLYSITKEGDSHHITAGNDTKQLISVERLQFSDTSIALDLDGNAGTAAKILGAVFGKDSVSNAEYAGIGLDLLDEGMSYEELVELALTASGATTNCDVVDTLYQNLTGLIPSDADAAPYLAWLDEGTYSKGALGVFAAELELNLINIDFVGLQETGLDYLLV
jgi:hypothetical protein